MNTDRTILPNDCLWESLPIRRDRVPNELNDVSELWQASLNPHHPMNLSAPTFFKTEFGNINGDGSPTSFSSPILGMQNMHLADSLEPAIAPLVLLIRDFGLVTYSSCEGHLIHGEFYEGYAGILYDEMQHAKTIEFLCAAMNSGFKPFRTYLNDSLDGAHLRTLEVYFMRDASTSLVEYHHALCLATSMLTLEVDPNLGRVHGEGSPMT